MHLVDVPSRTARLFSEAKSDRCWAQVKTAVGRISPARVFGSHLTAAPRRPPPRMSSAAIAERGGLERAQPIIAARQSSGPTHTIPCRAALPPLVFGMVRPNTPSSESAMISNGMSAVGAVPAWAWRDYLAVVRNLRHSSRTISSVSSMRRLQVAHVAVADQHSKPRAFSAVLPVAISASTRLLRAAKRRQRTAQDRRPARSRLADRNAALDSGEYFAGPCG